MAIHGVDIPDEFLDQVVAALAYNYGHQDQIDNPNFNNEEPVSEDNPEKIENPETVGMFANRCVRNFLIDNVKTAQIRQATEAAKLAAEQALANLELGITDPDPT